MDGNYKAFPEDSATTVRVAQLLTDHQDFPPWSGADRPDRAERAMSARDRLQPWLRYVDPADQAHYLRRPAPHSPAAEVLAQLVLRPVPALLLPGMEALRLVARDGNGTPVVLYLKPEGARHADLFHIARDLATLDHMGAAAPHAALIAPDFAPRLVAQAHLVPGLGLHATVSRKGTACRSISQGF